jgi:acetoin utilization deacetylase AcuC-like enzyme
MARGTGDDAFLKTLDTALAQVSNFGPDVLVVALGLDASIDDPFQGFAVTQDGFSAIGSAIASLKIPVLFVQEGGYLSDTLGVNLTRVLAGYQGAV